MSDIDLEEEGGEAGRSSTLSESLRKALVTGLSAVLVTEEGIRGVLGDMRLPKDAMTYLAQQAERTRRELYRAVSNELQRFLQNVDLTKELRQALRGMKLELRAEVRFSDAGEPTTSMTAEVKSAAPVKPKTPRRRRGIPEDPDR